MPETRISRHFPVARFIAIYRDVVFPCTAKSVTVLLVLFYSGSSLQSQTTPSIRKPVAEKAMSAAGDFILIRIQEKRREERGKGGCCHADGETRAKKRNRNRYGRPTYYWKRKFCHVPILPCWHHHPYYVNGSYWALLLIQRVNLKSNSCDVNCCLLHGCEIIKTRQL